MLLPKIHKINPGNPSADIIHEAAVVVRKGGVIAFPTRCLYGLGADALNPEAVDRIFKIKQRSTEKPILILIDDPVRLKRLVTTVSGTATAIMDRFWPGKVTLVFEARAEVPPYLTADSGKIGVRLPEHPVASSLVRELQGPITGTSANVSGRPGCYQIGDLPPEVTEKLDLILDAGPLKGGRGSTVVDVTGQVPQVLREGEVSIQDIIAIGGK
jgi:L-threonylcarbamoyladenylate synthase